MECIDKTIEAMSEWIQNKLKENRYETEKWKGIAEMAKALAELVSASRKGGGNKMFVPQTMFPEKFEYRSSYKTSGNHQRERLYPRKKDGASTDGAEIKKPTRLDAVGELLGKNFTDREIKCSLHYLGAKRLI